MAFIIASGSISLPSLTIVRSSNVLPLRDLRALSINVWTLTVQLSYISSHFSFIFFIIPRPRFLSCSLIVSKVTVISVVLLWVFFKVVSSSISSCTFSLPKFISNFFFNLAALSLKFCFDTWFFSEHCPSHLRFNFNINPLPLLCSSSAVVTSCLFSLSVFVDMGWSFSASPFGIASFLAILFP